MCRFIETIQIRKGIVQNIHYHNQRMNNTRKEIFGLTEPLDLLDYIDVSQIGDCVKCRVIYGEEIQEVTYAAYTMRPVHSLRLVYSDLIEYQYKSLDREALNELFSLRDTQDDILIVKNNFLTDTSIGNIALEKAGIWYTPASPLLKGTKRAALLDKGVLQEKEITVDEIYLYSHMMIFNAMIDFGSLPLEINVDTIR